MLSVEQGWLSLTLEDVRGLEDDALATLFATNGDSTLARRGSLSHHYVSQCRTLLEGVSLSPYLGVTNVSASPKRQFKIVVNLVSQFVR